MPLFRAESEESRANAWLGRILLIRPLSFTALSAAAIALAACVAGFFAFGEYTRKARVTGTLSPVNGVVRVIAQQAGVVRALHAREGERVEKGTTLLTLADGRAMREDEAIADSIALHFTQRERALARQRAHAVAAAEAERGALAEREAGLAREILLVGAEMALHEERVALARAEVGRSGQLAGRGFVSAAALDRERAAALDHEARLEALRRNRSALVREAHALSFEARNARARGDAQLAAIDAQAAALAQERVERAFLYRATIPSPASGTLAAVLVDSGQMVPAGATLATIVPADGRLEAHLFAPSRSIGFAREGQSVLLRYVAFPHQKFGAHAGRIAAIARHPLAPGELGFVPPDGGREPLYRIKVALPSQTIDAYGRPEPLQPGMLVEADIQLDRRPLIEWIFEPLLSLAGRA